MSLSLSLVQPLVTNNGTVDVLATVRNNGPADAEGVQVQVGVGGPDNTGVPRLECFPEGVAICNAGGGALIPSLPAGTAMNVEFVYNYFCGALTCTQWVDGSLFALTSDPNLANNFASIRCPSPPGLKRSWLLLSLCCTTAATLPYSPAAPTIRLPRQTRR